MANDGLKHVVHRRVHLERSQPEHRKRKVGRFLEKKADYKKRAERYHVREKIIKELSAKTRFRNEDEFNFKMIYGKIGDEGQVILESEESAKNRKLTKKAQVKNDLRILDRNLFLLNHKRNSTKKKLDKLIGSNPGVVKSGKPKHILFDTESNTDSVPDVEFHQDDEELFKLSDTFDKNKELERLQNKIEDRRNLTVAKYKKRQVRKVRDSDSNVRVHEFVTERLK